MITTGLVTNLEKSNIYLARVEDDVKQSIIYMTSVTLGSLPMRYLGLPLFSRKQNKVDCRQLEEKITSRITQATPSNFHMLGDCKLKMQVCHNMC